MHPALLTAVATGVGSLPHRDAVARADRGEHTGGPAGDPEGRGLAVGGLYRVLRVGPAPGQARRIRTASERGWDEEDVEASEQKAERQPHVSAIQPPRNPLVITPT